MSKAFPQIYIFLKQIDNTSVFLKYVSEVERILGNEQNKNRKFGLY